MSHPRNYGANPDQNFDWDNLTGTEDSPETVAALRAQAEREAALTAAKESLHKSGSSDIINHSLDNIRRALAAAKNANSDNRHIVAAAKEIKHEAMRRRAPSCENNNAGVNPHYLPRQSFSFGDGQPFAVAAQRALQDSMDAVVAAAQATSLNTSQPVVASAMEQDTGQAATPANSESGAMQVDSNSELTRSVLNSGASLAASSPSNPRLFGSVVLNDPPSPQTNLSRSTPPTSRK